MPARVRASTRARRLENRASRRFNCAFYPARVEEHRVLRVYYGKR